MYWLFETALEHREHGVPIPGDPGIDLCFAVRLVAGFGASSAVLAGSCYHARFKDGREGVVARGYLNDLFRLAPLRAQALASLAAARRRSIDEETASRGQVEVSLP
jgi:hypothetical protein